MSGFIAMVTIIGKFSEIIGKPAKWVKNKNKDHELLIQTANNLTELQEQHKKDIVDVKIHDQEIKNDIKELKDMILSQSIDDIRWEILDFSSAVINNRKYNREAYDHIFRQYEKYENILRENKMENGLVEESITVIREMYRDKLKSGEIK
jgi:hypothetical protein